MNFKTSAELAGMKCEEIKNQVDAELFGVIKQEWAEKYRTVVFDSATDDEEYEIRHYRFDAWSIEGEKSGIHVYLSLRNNEVVDGYESMGENIDMAEPS